MKRLHLFLIKSFIGPFILIFFIVLFLLLMQFLWRYIDDLVGKGLEIPVIAELLLYTSANLVPLALPLSILMAALMTFGNLGEYYELTAIKASGISLQRFLMPLIFLVIFISYGAFLFSNHVLPYTNLQMRSLLHEKKKKKPEFQIKPGEFYNDIEGYSIYIQKRDYQSNALYGIKIYDHTRRDGNTTVIMADSGNMKLTVDDRYLIVSLYNGKSYNELEEDKKGRRNRTYPHRMDIFKERRIIMELTDFGLQRTDQDLFKKHYQMMNLKQLRFSIDSLKKMIEDRNNQLYSSLIHQYIYPKRGSRDNMESPLIDTDSIIEAQAYTIQRKIITEALIKARASERLMHTLVQNVEYKTKDMRKHEIEWHRKFTISFACLIFLFIGAPLGAIIRKGGLGMPVVISTLFFIFYYIISMSGEKFVRESMLTSFQGMWVSSLMLFFFGVFLTYKATTDSSIMNMETYGIMLKKLIGIRSKTMVERKGYIQKILIHDSLDFEKTQQLLNNIHKESASVLELLSRKKSFYAQIQRLLRSKMPPEIADFYTHYHSLFDYLVTTKLYSVKYFRSKIELLPAIYPKTVYYNNTETIINTISLFLFPIGILKFIIHIVYFNIFLKRISSINALTNSMLNALKKKSFIDEIKETI